MKDLKDRLKNLKKPEAKNPSQNGDPGQELSIRERLERLVESNLKKRETLKKTNAGRPSISQDEPFVIKQFTYPNDAFFGSVQFREWQTVSPDMLAVVAGDERFREVDPKKLLYFDAETTGIAGGTGTIPFMLGFGLLKDNQFKVRIFVLKDLNREDQFLEAVDDFLGSSDFSATVTFNGKAFDFPVLETRYILHRRRFTLVDKPHLDFLFPARTLWKHTHDSRRLGYLGEVLLGLSRSEDIESSEIPTLYFNFLRTNLFELLESVIDHNAMDIVGLSALLLLAVKYVADYSYTTDEGEILGVAVLCERFGLLESAENLYRVLHQSAVRKNVASRATRQLSLLLKKKRLFEDAHELWRQLASDDDHQALHELSVHYEHRQKDFHHAISVVEQALSLSHISETRRFDFVKRFERLKKKIQKLEQEE